MYELIKRSVSVNKKEIKYIRLGDVKRIKYVGLWRIKGGKYMWGYEHRGFSHLGVVDTLLLLLLLLLLLAAATVEEDIPTSVAGNCTIAPPAVTMVVNIEGDDEVPGMRVGTRGAAIPRARARWTISSRFSNTRNAYHIIGSNSNDNSNSNSNDNNKRSNKV